MDEYQSLIRETFVLRLWREAVNPAWRGQIVHLPDQESIPFTTLAEAEEFIRRFVPDVRARQPPPGEDAEAAEDETGRP
jgi:hypothetical protein